MAYANGRDRSRETERRAAAAIRDKKARAEDARIAELDRQIAYTQGQIDAIRDRALTDDALREAVRVALWAKVPGAVSAQYVDGEVVLTAPDGLPDGITECDLEAAMLSGLAFPQ